MDDFDDDGDLLDADEKLTLGWYGDATPAPERDLVPLPVGKKTTYQPIFARVAENACRGGATDQDLAFLFGVHVATIYRWKAEFIDFKHATQLGKEEVDDRVEQSLLARATGYRYRSKKVFQHEGAPVIVPIVEHVPGDVKAQLAWLHNRRPEKWRNRTELTGANGTPLIPSDPVSIKEAARYYAFLFARANAITVDEDEGQ